MSSSYFRYLGNFNLHVRLKNKQTNKLSKQFAYKLAKLQDKQIQKETHNIVPNSLESLWQKAQWALPFAPISCLLEHYFLIRVFPSWLCSHPLNMYLKHEELKRGDMSSNGFGG